jgi:spermidine/putrescine transport system substrate-binding protein
MRVWWMSLMVAVSTLVSTASALAAEELRFGNWPRYYPPELLTRFEKETGIKVKLTEYDSDAAMANKIRAGGSDYDVVIVSDLYVHTLSQQKLIEKLDQTQLPNRANILPDYRAPVADPGRAYGMPYLIITTGLVYDTKQVPGGTLPETWKTFFDPPAFLRGKIAALDVEEEMYMAAAWYLGLDECTEKPADAKRILKVLLDQKPAVLTYANDGMVERLRSKQVILQHDWSDDPLRHHDEVPTITFMFPKEGVHAYLDNFVIPIGARNTKNAHRFINWMMEPRNIAVASNFNKYRNVIAGSAAYLSADLKTDPTLNPSPDILKRVRPMKICSPAAMDLRNKVWVKLKG